MHLEKIRENQGSRFDRYVIGTLIIVFTFFVAQIPHTYAVIKAVGLEQLGTLDVAGILQALPPNTTLVLMLFPFALVAVLVLVLIRYLHNISIREFITARDKIDWKRIGFAFTGIVLLNSLFFIISYYTNPSDFQWNFDPQAFATLFLIAIVLVPLQTSAEELFFRGYLMQGFGQIFKNRIFPLLITSLLFGFMHFGNPEIDKLGPLLIVSYVSMGFFFGIITLMDEGLELALGYHAGNNLLISLLVTSDWTAFQTHSLFLDVSEPDVYMLAFMQLPMLIILLLLFSWKYKWKNYRTHLLGSATNQLNEMSKKKNITNISILAGGVLIFYFALIKPINPCDCLDATVTNNTSTYKKCLDQDYDKAFGYAEKYLSNQKFTSQEAVLDSYWTEKCNR